MVTKMGGKQKQSGMDESKLAGKTPRRVKMPPIPTQEQILDKFAKAFKVRLESLGTVTTVEYVEELEKITVRAQRVLEHMAEAYPVEKYPKSDIHVLNRKTLLQSLAERAEILSIAEGLKGQGLEKIAKRVNSKVRNGIKISTAEYEEFFQKFVVGEEPIETVLNQTYLTKSERAGIDAILKEGRNRDLLEFGRAFGSLKGIIETPKGLRAWFWDTAGQVAKVNLTHIFGSATWAWDLARHGKKAASIGEHFVRQGKTKYSGAKEAFNIRNIGKYGSKTVLGVAFVLGAGYLVYSCGSWVMGSDEKEGSRPSVKKKKRTPVSPAEIELYKNPLFKAKDETRTPKFVVIAKHMTNMKLKDEEQVKVAKILNKLSETSKIFIMGTKLRQSIELAIILRTLSPKVSTQKIAETAIAIQDYVDPQQTKKFAQQLAKKATSTADIMALFETPPRNIKMVDAWYNRVFPAFTKAGFSEKDNLLPLLCGTIRRARVKKRGKEGAYALTMVEQNNLATSLAAIYGSGRRPGVPKTYHEDIEFILQMRAKGFKVTTAASVMSRLRFVYDPKHLNSASDIVLRKLRPGMGEYQMRIAIESPAFEKRGWASKAWKSAPDKRLLDLFTSARDAGKFSSQLRALPQKEYEDAIETLESFANIWQAKMETLTSKKIAEVMSQVISLARSKALAHMNPDKKSQILFQLVSKVSAPTRGEDLRAAALKHLENKFKGKKPTVAAVLAELDTYLEPEEITGTGAE